MYIYIYIYMYICITMIYVSLYIYIYIYIYVLWKEDDAKQLYLVLKVSCRRTDNLQPGTTIIVLHRLLSTIL